MNQAQHRFATRGLSALFALFPLVTLSFAATPQPNRDPSARSIVAASGGYEVSESELATYQLPKLEAKSSAPTKALAMEARRTAAESLLRLKAVEASNLEKRTSKSERAWLDLSTRIARASALLDLEEVRALGKLNSNPKALRERAYENYLANPIRFSVPTSAEVSVLLINPAEIGFENAVTSITAAQKELAAGNDFDQVAARYSAAKTTRSTSQVRYSVSPQETEPSIVRWVFQEAKPGEVYGPYVVGGMFSMVKFHSRKPPFTRPFEEVADDEIDRVRKTAAAAARAVVVDKLLPSPIEYFDPPREPAVRGRR